MNYMKKIILVAFPVFLCLSCANGRYTYSSLISKLKGYQDETLMRNEYLNNHYHEQGFFTNANNDITLFSTTNSKDSETYLYLQLDTATDVPNYFYCVLTFSVYDTGYSEVASFYLGNDYSKDTKLTFHVFNGDDYMKDSSLDLAKSSVNLLLTVFDAWLQDELKISMHDVGLFPNY